MRKFIRNIFLFFNVFFALALASTYLVPYINPQKFWIPSLLSLFQLYLFLINVAFIAFWLLFKWKFLLISLVCILAGLFNIGNFIRYTPRNTDRTDGIKVLSYNVHHFYSYSKKKKNEDNIIDFIAKQNADIICLQEAVLQKTGELNPLKLKTRFPGIVHCQLAHMSRWGGPVTYSKFPIIHMGEIRFKESSNMVIFSDIVRGNDTVRVYNCHLQSFGIQKEEYAIMDTIRFETNKLIEAKTLGGKIKRANKKRAKQVSLLVEHIQKCPYQQIIVCGDFNDLPNSYPYSSMTKLLKDAYVGSGTGLSKTFRHRIAPYRIDYIFHSKHFRSYNYTRHKIDYSDHYPISVFFITEQLYGGKKVF